jgi:ABC-2 type transport system ATP-binding protein
MKSPVLSVAAVTKRYGRTVALEAIEFEAGAHQFIALLGPNGAGKSTLVQLLTGLFVPDEGFIRVLGHDMRNDPVRALAAIGVVFQQPTLDPELSVIGNLRFHTDLHGLDGRTASRRIDEALGRLGLAHHARDKVLKLSGGNRRRVELARALLHRPRILIMDEPTVGLDPQARRDILSHVHALCRDEGLLALWATHLTEEAEAADRLLFLNRGRLVFDGTAAGAIAQSGAGSLEQAFFAMAKDPLSQAGPA